MIARSDHTSAELVNKDKQIVTRLGDQKNTKNGHKVRTAAARAKRALRVIEAVKSKAGSVAVVDQLEPSWNESDARVKLRMQTLTD